MTKFYLLIKINFRVQQFQGMGQEDVMKYGNWNKAMKNLDYKMKKFAPVLKNSENNGQKVFEPHSQRNKKNNK